ncbi:hypothetical protein EJ04DRAFT_606852 [Polyplosphaeria fusca]|uniref:Uncharacterized protein n=1 Tax=Polyplosphaeria fusca TaxID=682080 RepID=A0A9P4V264_9PLEO|nr:hypothetical protein EJ04DRAFT_606852 [Polyplosphaeria fusca]
MSVKHRDLTWLHATLPYCSMSQFQAFSLKIVPLSPFIPSPLNPPNSIPSPYSSAPTSLTQPKPSHPADLSLPLGADRHMSMYLLCMNPIIPLCILHRHTPTPTRHGAPETLAAGPISTTDLPLRTAPAETLTFSFSHSFVLARETALSQAKARHMQGPAFANKIEPIPSLSRPASTIAQARYVQNSVFSLRTAANIPGKFLAEKREGKACEARVRVRVSPREEALSAISPFHSSRGALSSTFTHSQTDVRCTVVIFNLKSCARRGVDLDIICRKPCYR